MKFMSGLSLKKANSRIDNTFVRVAFWQMKKWAHRSFHGSHSIRIKVLYDTSVWTVHLKHFLFFAMPISPHHHCTNILLTIKCCFW